MIPNDIMLYRLSGDQNLIRTPSEKLLPQSMGSNTRPMTGQWAKSEGP